MCELHPRRLLAFVLMHHNGGSQLWTREVDLPWPIDSFVTADQQTKGKVMALEYWLETSVLRDRVWLQASDGSTVGRFSPRGIDLHNTITEQMAGMSECRMCTHGATSVEDWTFFREKAFEWWGIEVPADAFDIKLLACSTPTPSDNTANGAIAVTPAGS